MIQKDQAYRIVQLTNEADQLSVQLMHVDNIKMGDTFNIGRAGIIPFNVLYGAVKEYLRKELRKREEALAELLVQDAGEHKAERYPFGGP